MSEQAINHVDKDGYTALMLAAGSKLDKVCELLINKMSEQAIEHTLSDSYVEVKKFIQEKISHNNKLIEKLALFLKESFLDKDSLDNIIKIANVAKFYGIANKKLLKEYLQEQGTVDMDSILVKMDDFIKVHSFTISGICKKLTPNEKMLDGKKHILDLPVEIIKQIVSYLYHVPWGLDVETSTPVEAVNNNETIDLAGSISEVSLI